MPCYEFIIVLSCSQEIRMHEIVLLCKNFFSPLLWRQVLVSFYQWISFISNIVDTFVNSWYHLFYGKYV